VTKPPTYVLRISCDIRRENLADEDEAGVHGPSTMSLCLHVNAKNRHEAALKAADLIGDKLQMAAWPEAYWFDVDKAVAK